MSFCRSLALIGFTSFAALSYADAAKVISQQGDTQWRLGLQKEWQATQIDLTLDKGNHVQTGALSKLALLFRDDSQLRLNQNSFLIVKDVLDEKGNSTRFRLNKGRAWVKSKNIPDKLIFETPSAVAAIRGTDWDIEVSDDGTSKITVLHGEIYFANDFGAVSVKANEQAIAEVGKAPVKLLITNASERVQWVSEYTFDITQYKSLATTAKERAILQSNIHSPVQSTTQLQKSLNALPQSPFKQAALADIALYLGDTKQAISLIEQLANYPTIPELYVLWGRAHLISGKPQVLVGDNPDILLLNAEMALFDGQGNEAIDLLNQVLERERDNYDALYLLGRIFTEKEYTDLALNYLTQAKHENSQRFEAHAELATLHTYNNQFNLARSELANAEANGAHGALVNTALGILNLKQGELDHAKRAFLAATTLAPNYARANTYLAITYYQQGQLELANDTLMYAIEQDDNDPMPYFMRAIFERELANPQQSLNAVTAANKRLPNLKSLNQLANNLQGGTDLGAAYAEYGLTERALYTGLSNYDPQWAGSQLFVSSQIENNHSAKLSELFKGLLNDPTAFATNYATQDMVQQPGVNGVIRYKSNNESGGNSNETDSQSPSMQLNSYSNSWIPISFMADIRKTRSQIAKTIDSDTDNYQLGIGLKPTNKLNVFTFYNKLLLDTNPVVIETRYDDTSTNGFNQIITDTNASIEDIYAGIAYNFTPNWKISYWLSEIDYLSLVNTDNSTLLVSSEVNPNFEFSKMSQSTSSNLDNGSFNQTGHVFAVDYLNETQDSIGFVLSSDTIRASNKNMSATSSYDETRIYNEFSGEIVTTTKLDFLNEISILDRSDITTAAFTYRTGRSSRVNTELQITHTKIKSESQIDNYIKVDELIKNVNKKNEKNTKFTGYGLGLNYSLTNNHTFSVNFLKTLNSGNAVSPSFSFLGNMPIDTQYVRTGSDNKQFSSQIAFEDEFTFYRFKYIHQLIDNDLLQGFLYSEQLDTSSEIRQLNNIVQEASFYDDPAKSYYRNVSHIIEEARINDYYFDYEALLDDRLSLRYAIRYTRAEDLYQPEATEKPVDPFIQLPEFQTNLQLMYTTSFYAQSYFKIGFIDFYDPADAKTESKNTALLQLGWQQEFFNKQLKLAAYYSQLPAHQKSDVYLNAEWRF